MTKDIPITQISLRQAERFISKLIFSIFFFMLVFPLLGFYSMLAFDGKFVGFGAFGCIVTFGFMYCSAKAQEAKIKKYNEKKKVL